MAKVIPIIPGGEVSASRIKFGVSPNAIEGSVDAYVVYVPPKQTFHRRFIGEPAEAVVAWQEEMKKQIMGAEEA